MELKTGTSRDPSGGPSGSGYAPVISGVTGKNVSLQLNESALAFGGGGSSGGSVRTRSSSSGALVICASGDVLKSCLLEGVSVAGVDAVKVKRDAEDPVECRERCRRYLQCPAAVGMSHLKKFIRMKYGLTDEHRVSGYFFFCVCFFFV